MSNSSIGPLRATAAGLMWTLGCVLSGAERRSAGLVLFIALLLMFTFSEAKTLAAAPVRRNELWLPALLVAAFVGSAIYAAAGGKISPPSWLSPTPPWPHVGLWVFGITCLVIGQVRYRKGARDGT